MSSVRSDFQPCHDAMLMPSVPLLLPLLLLQVRAFCSGVRVRVQLIYDVLMQVDKDKNARCDADHRPAFAGHFVTSPKASSRYRSISQDRPIRWHQDVSVGENIRSSSTSDLYYANIPVNIRQHLSIHLYMISALITSSSSGHDDVPADW